MRAYCSVIAIAILLVTSLFAQTQQAGSTSPSPPLSVSDVEHGLKAGVTNTRMAALVKQYGVDFELTDAVEKQLRTAGANTDLLLAVSRGKRLGVKTPDQSNAPPQEKANASADPMDRAESDLKAGRMRDAVLEAQDIIKGNPSNLEAHMLLGRIYSQSLGDMQANGDDFKMVVKMAIEQYEQIVKIQPNRIHEHMALGRLYRLNNDLQKAEREVRTARRVAETGNAEVQVDYADALVEEQSYADAATWYRKAADRGNARAEADLGYAYLGGVGVSKDYAEAMKWNRKAADQGNAMAQNDLGYTYVKGLGVDKDYVEAMKWYRKAAEQGNVMAQKALGHIYASGVGGTKNYVEALKWFREAAEKGDPEGEFSLGEMYFHGSGVSKDYAEAMKWFRDAAEKGNATSEFYLGYMYINGLGAPQDYADGANWYRKAGDQGNAQAQAALSGLYLKGLGVSKDYAEAMKWGRKAADQGDNFSDAQNNAQYNVGYLYENGLGIPQDLQAAREWYQKAADRGNAAARERLNGRFASPTTPTGTMAVDATSDRGRGDPHDPNVMATDSTGTDGLASAGDPQDTLAVSTNAAAYDCVKRGVTPGQPWPVVALRNACSKAISVYFCWLSDDLPGDEWGCGQAQIEAAKTTTHGEMDMWKMDCVEGHYPGVSRPDPSCSHYKVIWNAVYQDSRQTPPRPNVPQRSTPQTAR